MIWNSWKRKHFSCFPQPTRPSRCDVTLGLHPSPDHFLAGKIEILLVKRTEPFTLSQMIPTQDHYQWQKMRTGVGIVGAHISPGISVSSLFWKMQSFLAYNPFSPRKRNSRNMCTTTPPPQFYLYRVNGSIEHRVCWIRAAYRVRPRVSGGPIMPP